MPDRDFWHGKRVFVTGHTGFKGSWLCLWLEALGVDLVGYSSGVPTTPSLFDLARVAEGMTSTTGDVADHASLCRAIEDARPEVVFHLAAQSLVRRSYADPIETYRTNVMGTVHLLDAVRRVPSCRVVVNVTSDKCYENKEWIWGYREDEPKGGRDPYSSSKACAELVTDAFRRSFFEAPGRTGTRPVALASARAGNVIGGGDWGADRLVPDVIRATLTGDVARIRHPDAIRPWQHVVDCLSGYLLLAERLWASDSYAGGWNFGPTEANVRSVRWILDRLNDLWDGGVRWEHDAGSHPHEAVTLRLDSSKARLQLGWKPRWNVDEALRRVVEWYRCYRAGLDVRTVVLEQIAAYESTKPGWDDGWDAG